MNAMLYVRGRPLDYDLWEQQGATGWGWEGVKDYFLKSENREGGPSEYHAVGGELNVADENSPRAITETFLVAAEAAGIPRIDDYNGPEQDGAALVQVTQKNGKRLSTAEAFLRPVMKRPNLEVVRGAQVLRVDIEDGRATGVRYREGGETKVARARKDIVLSAGAYGSPQILMLSGVGPADHLREVGVPLHVDLPGVGMNLQDHPYLLGIWDLPGGGSLADAEHPKYLLEWLFKKTGPLTSTVAEAFAFVRTRPGLPAPDVQFHFAPAYFADHGAGEYDGHAMSFGPVLVTPKSRGRVWLRSVDPLAKPRILTNSLTEPEDIASMVAGHEARPRDRQAVRRRRRPRDLPGLGRDDRRRSRGRPAPPRRAALPPGRHLPHRDGRHGRRRSRPARARRRGAARRRRVRHARHPRRQHECPDDHDRREGRGPDPRSRGRSG